MIWLLGQAAAIRPRHIAVLTDETAVTYDELLFDARCVAAGLRERQITRFAIVERDAALIVRLLAGAALAGAEPCQYQPDISPVDFAAEAAALEHAVLVTRRDDLNGSRTLIRPTQLTADEPLQRPSGINDPQPILIRTTGTTGLPKAARHDWRRLARTVERVVPRPHQRWLLAYGPHQFAGIQILQHVLASQATLVAPFPRRPRDGLAALLREGVTCLSATPTYWRFLLAEARSQDVELPPLEQVTLGGEASPADLLARLRAEFPDARISHVYASTEFGSVASVRDGRPGLPIESLYSEANPEAHVRVVDGELWVRARAGMLGYADADAEVGDAETTPTEVSAEWRATGDLVEITDDRVVFRGRSSEVVNVGGTKVHPLPIESLITALDRVAMARVFGRPNPLMGAIVAAEVVPIAGVEAAEHDDLRREIMAALADLPRPWQPRSLKFVHAIETRGEKTIRGVRA
jgi:acyl-CoA synthetase (AMP-forming)/AMP-acid ligase II